MEQPSRQTDIYVCLLTVTDKTYDKSNTLPVMQNTYSLKPFSYFFKSSLPLTSSFLKCRESQSPLNCLRSVACVTDTFVFLRSFWRIQKRVLLSEAPKKSLVCNTAV